MKKKTKETQDQQPGIGTTTGCTGGNEYIKGKTVKIVTVWKGARLPGFDQDAPDAKVADNDTLMRLGGISIYDEIDVETVGWREVSSGTVSPRDLECCKELKPRVKLIGEDGNAFNILAKVKAALLLAGLKKEAAEFLEEATSGDYDHLLAVVQRYVDVE